MILKGDGPSCHLSWTVSKISAGFYAVSATSNGADYDFVGNFASLTDAHRAGRLYAQQMMHGSHSRFPLNAQQIAA